MINKRLSIWILLLTLAWPLFGAIRINEIMFDTGGDPDTEFIELYNNGAGSVDLEGWSLVVDGTTLVTFESSLTIAGGQYLAIFVGSPAAPPASSYSLGLTEPAIGDTGAEILLQDDNGDPHDYIAYGAVPQANPPSPLIFPEPISPGSWDYGDGLAFIEPDGTNSDDPKQWINRRSANITPGAANTQQPAPTVSYGTINVPGTFPTVNACEEIEVPINVNYNHETPVINANLTFTLPSGFLFASASDSGVFDNTTRSVSWSLGTLGGDKSVSVRVRPNCEITSGQFSSEAVELSFRRYPSQSPTPTVNATNSSSSITIKQPELEVKMTQYGTGNRAAIAEISSMVEFQIEVTNKGTAPLTGFGAYISLNLKDDLLFVSFRKNSPTGPAVDYLELNFIDSVFTGWTGHMGPGETRTYYVKALNIDCAPELGSARVWVGWGCGDSEPGTQSCWKTVNTGASVLCPPTLTFEVPEGAPDVYMGCQNVTHHIVIGNSNGVPIKVTGLELSLPTDTYWISSKIGDTDVGTYDQATKTLTFTAAELTSNSDHYLPAHSDITIVLVMRPNCTANTDRRASGVFNYEFGCPFCGWLPGSVSRTGRGVPLLQPALAVTVQDPADPTKTTVLAERGKTVTFKVVVDNNGLGDLNTDGKPEGEEGGWVELFNIGSGLELQSITDITGVSTPVTWQLHGERQRWATGTMPSKTRRTYLVSFLVINCINVGYEVGTYWTCAGTDPADTCRQDGESKGSVNIVLRNPSLTLGIAPDTLVIDYCEGATLSIPVSNANEEVNGMARNVSINLVGLSAEQFDITMEDNEPFILSSFENNVATFSLIHGDDADHNGETYDIEPGKSFDLNFTVKVKTCNASSGGTLIYQPYYEDSCNIPYTSGTQISSFSRTPQAGA
ncbi:MAG: hypothetical protein GX946_02475, partial [Oligosphaeraceae bacterium]|nr:hypothetical protein [Oligosphaeraceae bacterium]